MKIQRHRRIRPRSCRMSAKIQLDMVGHDILLLLRPPLISDSIFGDIATSCWCAGCIEAGDPAIFAQNAGKGQPNWETRRCRPSSFQDWCRRDSPGCCGRSPPTCSRRTPWMPSSPRPPTPSRLPLASSSEQGTCQWQGPQTPGRPPGQAFFSKHKISHIFGHGHFSEKCAFVESSIFGSLLWRDVSHK